MDKVEKRFLLEIEKVRDEHVSQKDLKGIIKSIDSLVAELHVTNQRIDKLLMKDFGHDPRSVDN